MKYIKEYEQIIDRQPKIGDYVICVEDRNNNKKEKILFDEYTKTHIGQIIKIDETYEFLVQYNTISINYDILNYAFYTTDRTIVKGLKYKTVKIGTNTYTNITSFSKKEILFFSDDIEIVKDYMESNMNQIKYNL